jgi:Rad3-related DNA helicase
VWAAKAESHLKSHISSIHSPHLRALERERQEKLLDKLHRLQSLSSSNWTCEISEGTKYGRFWKFDCVWPGQYSEMLFQGIPNIILMSGTLRPRTLSELGIKRSLCDFRSWPHVFPKSRSPFYHIVTSSMKYPVSAENEQKQIDQMDKFIEPRLGRKGIIQTVSYAKQRLILERSRFRSFMVGNSPDPDSPEAAEIVQRFKSSSAPCILVSPSFSTGYDFPACEAEWQWIVSIPFPPMLSKVMKRRRELDPSYQLAQAAKELGQMAGRGMRFERDRCEIATGDDRIDFFLKQAAQYLPEGFDVIRVLDVPKPGPRWNER